MGREADYAIDPRSKNLTGLGIEALSSDDAVVIEAVDETIEVARRRRSVVDDQAAADNSAEKTVSPFLRRNSVEKNLTFIQRTLVKLSKEGESRTVP